MDRRQFPRQDVREAPIKASLVIEGGSLINPEASQSVEIYAKPINLSETGICLVLSLEALWQTTALNNEVTLLVEMGDLKETCNAEVVRIQKNGKTKLGLRFSKPLNNMARFLISEDASEITIH